MAFQTSKILLAELDSLADRMSEGVFDRRKMSYGYEAYIDYTRLRSRQAREAIRRLERAGVLRVDRIDGRLDSFILTELGQKQAEEASITMVNRCFIGRRFCQVIFDIPEVDKALRYKIRTLLKKIGFTKIQRSVWGSKKIVHKKLARYFHQYYPTLDIKVLVSREV